MAITGHRAISELLRYFSPDEQALPPSSAQYADRWQIAAKAYNAAFAEMALALGKSYQSMRERGWLFDGPTPVTISLTRGNRSATISSTDALMGGNVTGRLLQIGGRDCRIHWQTGSSGSGPYLYQVELTDEWIGETATVGATLHTDARVMDADILSIHSIANDSGLPLDPVGSDAGALRIMGGPTRDFGFEKRRNVRRWAQSVKMSSLSGQIPQCYSVRQPKPDSSETKILTIYPPPSAPTIFRGRVLTGPFSFDIPAIAAASNLVTALQAILLPISDAFYDSVIYPIAAQNLRSSPNFRNDSAVSEISRKYQAALTQIEYLRIQGVSRTQLIPA